MKKLLFVALLVISTSLFAQDNSPSAVGENYTKKEVHIKMRDGVSLYTVIYTPKTTLKIPNNNATHTLQLCTLWSWSV
jgi:predicted acyl esterase